MANLMFNTEIPEAIRAIHINDIGAGQFFCFCSNPSIVCMVVDNKSKQYFCFETMCAYDVDGDEWETPVYIIDANIVVNKYYKDFNKLFN